MPEPSPAVTLGRSPRSTSRYPGAGPGTVGGSANSSAIHGGASSVTGGSGRVSEKGRNRLRGNS